MDEFADAGFRQEGENGLAKGGAGARVARIEFLDPVLGLLTDAIDHGCFSDTGAADEEKGGG